MADSVTAAVRGAAAARRAGEPSTRPFFSLLVLRSFLIRASQRREIYEPQTKGSTN
jgi:hypothetical protein